MIDVTLLTLCRTTVKIPREDIVNAQRIEVPAQNAYLIVQDMDLGKNQVL